MLGLLVHNLEDFRASFCFYRSLCVWRQSAFCGGVNSILLFYLMLLWEIAIYHSLMVQLIDLPLGGASADSPVSRF